MDEQREKVAHHTQEQVGQTCVRHSSRHAVRGDPTTMKSKQTRVSHVMLELNRTHEFVHKFVRFLVGMAGIDRQLKLYGVVSIGIIRRHGTLMTT